MDDKEFNEFIENRITKGILTPMSKEMVRNYLKYPGALNDETKKCTTVFGNYTKKKR
jgi:hypothetical protein